jgi:hypothetical protein
VVSGLVKKIAECDNAGRFARKFRASAGVELPKTRMTGFNSCPPLWSLERVTAKWAPFRAAAVRKNFVLTVPKLG